MKRVVITGLGVVAPNACGIDEFRNALLEAKSGIRFSAEMQQKNFGCQIAGIPDISQSKYIAMLTKYGLETASDIIRYAFLAGLECWENAGLSITEDKETPPDFETGIIIGSGIGSSDIFGERIVPFTNEGNIKKLRSTIVEHSMLSGPAAILAGVLGAGNQVTSNSSACSTSTEAIIMAYERIKTGKAVRMIAGGTDAASVYGWSGFDAMRVLTRKHNDEPEKGSRPMSASASGFVPGAGAGLLLLEDLDSATKRGAKIWGEILAGHVNCGGQRNGGTMTAPNPEGVIRCIQTAVKEANIAPSEIGFISGHLSSTMADPIEVKNWSEALGLSGNSFPYIHALKSLTGHCIGAAGSIETIASLIAMNDGFVPKTLNCEDLHPEIEPILNSKKLPFIHHNSEFNIFAKASFGFGDVNSCLIVKKY